MTAIPLPVSDLNDGGASFMLEQLYGLPEDCVSSWASMGPVLERHKVSIQYYSANSEWEALIENEDATEECSTAYNPRLAVARALIKKTISENPKNSFTISLPLKEAFAIGLKRESGVMNLHKIIHGSVDEAEKVTIELQNF